MTYSRESEVDMEIFKEINGTNGRYLVSNYGRVKSICKGREKILPQYKHTGGYLFVTLSLNGKTATKDVHRLVAEYFVPNPNNYPQVNHKDENKDNPRADNLEWCSPKYNANYGERNRKLMKEVEQYTVNGEQIKTFPSIKDAAKAVNGSMGNISWCCKRRWKTAYGYVWRYKNDLF